MTVKMIVTIVVRHDCSKGLRYHDSSEEPAIPTTLRGLQNVRIGVQQLT
jgi:hypothetical protein